jgi:hypothetical protein
MMDDKGRPKVKAAGEKPARQRQFPGLPPASLSAGYEQAVGRWSGSTMARLFGVRQ